MVTASYGFYQNAREALLPAFIFLGIVTIFTLSATLADEKNDWPGFRGRMMDGVFSGKVFDDAQNYQLEVAWRRPLGSGYSGIAVSGDYLVTMFSDSTSDLAIGMNARNGKELWRVRIDSTYKGHDGSHDGPISTPYIYKNKAFVLGPYGPFMALDVKTGKTLWSTHLVEDHQAVKPYYGFTTAPVVHQGVLVLEMGNPAGQTIAGFDTDNGNILWTAGNDTVNYQSPALIPVGGKNHLMFASDKFIYAIDSKSGKVTWEYPHGGDGRAMSSASLTPVSTGDGTMFLTHKYGESALFDLKIKEDDGQIQAEERWSNRNIRSTYNVALYHDGHLYSYSSRFLTCVDAQTGESKWKSRQPGDGFMTMVDGHLVLSTKKGSVHIVKATPEGYREIAGIDLFDNLAWTAPSFANKHIYVRSHGEIASLAVKKRSATVAMAGNAQLSSPFMAFIGQVQKADDKTAVIDAYMAGQASFPIIENKDIVHFVYRGPAEDVALVGDLIGARTEQPLARVDGTDLFYYSSPLEPDAFIKYAFIADYGQPKSDTLNSRVTPSIFGPMSWFSMPDWQAPDHIEAPPADRAVGRLDTLRLASKLVDFERKIDVYLPANYENSAARYPVAYVHGSDLALGWGQMQHSLDNLIGARIAPIIAVFIHPRPDSRGGEFLGDGRLTYAQSLAEEIVPFIDANYRTIASREARASVGHGFAAYGALFTAFKLPSVFGKVSSQSAFMLTSHRDVLYAVMPQAAEFPMEFYLEWAKYDYRSPLEQWDARVRNMELAKKLQAAGYPVNGIEVNEGFGYACWRNRTDKVLGRLFPLTQKSP